MIEKFVAIYVFIDDIMIEIGHKATLIPLKVCQKVINSELTLKVLSIK